MNAITHFYPANWPHLNLLAMFGLVVAFGTLGGLLAKRIAWLPTITGFMAVGLLIGPSGLGLLSADDLTRAQPLIDVALGLILFKLGTSLHPLMVLRSPALVVTSLLESLLTFAGVLALLVFLGMSPMAAVISASIAVSSSPSVLIHVAHELHAKGPTLDTAKALVALNNVLAFVLFTFALPFALSHTRNRLALEVRFSACCSSAMLVPRPSKSCPNDVLERSGTMPPCMFGNRD